MEQTFLQTRSTASRSSRPAQDVVETRRGAAQYAPWVSQDATSGVVSEAWELYKRHWRHLIPIAAVIYLAVAVLTLLLSALNSVVGAILATALSISVAQASAVA
jgi:uncharacterized membrane protein YesL